MFRPIELDPHAEDTEWPKGPKYWSRATNQWLTEKGKIKEQLDNDLDDSYYDTDIPEGFYKQRARQLLGTVCGNHIEAQGGFQVNLVVPKSGLGRVISNTNPLGPNSLLHVIRK